MTAESSDPPRGQWGDDGYDAGMVNTVDRHRREVAEVMPGRVMVLLRGPSLVLWVVLSRALLDWTHGREVATVVIVMVEVVVVVSADSISRRPL